MIEWNGNATCDQAVVGRPVQIYRLPFAAYDLLACLPA
jgi:hypothetical protein